MPIPFIGAIVAAVVPKLTEKIFDNLAADARVPVGRQDEPVAKPAVREAVEEAVRKEVAPILVNATNQEPKIQSRVLQGSTVGLLAAVASLFVEWHRGDLQMDEIVTHGTVILGTLWAIYGRLRSGLKPVGE